MSLQNYNDSLLASKIIPKLRKLLTFIRRNNDKLVCILIWQGLIRSIIGPLIEGLTNENWMSEFRKSLFNLVQPLELS
jgi:hypothetical protein